jgi:predicted ATPase
VRYQPAHVAVRRSVPGALPASGALYGRVRLMLEFSILGPVEVRRDGRVVALSGARSLVLLVGHRPTLLVLDNFEQVVDAAPGVARLLLGAPGLKVLATSRVPLRLAAEHQYAVPHLPLDDATTLFARRATAAGADFRLDDDNLPLVRELCMRLNGLPLAVTLAAARVQHLSLETMLR